MNASDASDDNANSEVSEEPIWANNILSASNNEVNTDSREYWYRRFFTSLAIGNAAAAFALGAFITGSEDRSGAASLVANEFSLYLLGAGLAGIIPFAMWLGLIAKKKAPRFEQSSPDTRPVSVGYKHPRFWALAYLLVKYMAFPIAMLSATIFVWAGAALVNDIQGLAKTNDVKQENVETDPESQISEVMKRE